MPRKRITKVEDKTTRVTVNTKSERAHVVTYQLVIGQTRAEAFNLTQKVNVMIKSGYIPYGSPFATGDFINLAGNKRPEIAQAMVRWETIKAKGRRGRINDSGKK